MSSISSENTNTRDELGIGSVRDAFAELLFPGTGAIMTRARYFLLAGVYGELTKIRRVWLLRQDSNLQPFG
jgi:hypothetical protein